MQPLRSYFLSNSWTKSEVITTSITLAFGLVSSSSCLAIGLTMGPNALYFYVAAGATGFNFSAFTATILSHFCKNKHSNRYQTPPPPNIFDSTVVTNKIDTFEPETREELLVPDQLNLHSFPNELISEILKFLNLKEIYYCSLTCKKFCQVFNHDLMLWKFLLKRDFQKDEKDLAKEKYKFWTMCLGTPMQMQPEAKTKDLTIKPKQISNHEIFVDAQKEFCCFSEFYQSKYFLFKGDKFINFSILDPLTLEPINEKLLPIEKSENVFFVSSQAILSFDFETLKVWSYSPSQEQKIEIVCMNNRLSLLLAYSLKESKKNYFCIDQFLICSFNETTTVTRTYIFDLGSTSNFYLISNRLRINQFCLTKIGEDCFFCFFDRSILSLYSLKTNKIIFRFSINKKISNQTLFVKAIESTFFFLTPTGVIICDLFSEDKKLEFKKYKVGRMFGSEILDFMFYHSELIVVTDSRITRYVLNNEKKPIHIGINKVIQKAFIESDQLIMVATDNSTYVQSLI